MRDGDRGGPRRGLYLPSGYRLDETDRELLILRREDGSEVANFSATGADATEVERAAWEDFRGRASSYRPRPSRGPDEDPGPFSCPHQLPRTHSRTSTS